MQRRNTHAAAYVLTSRDIDVLVFIGSMVFCTRSQVLRAGWFRTLDRLRRRLLVLLRAGLIEAISIGSRQEQLLRLTTKGLEVLRDSAASEVVDRIALPRGGIRRSAVAHHLAVVDARAYIAGLVRGGWFGQSR